ncbi:hypothetical protein [Rhodococcus sp. p52]|uniref:hypothetical protein n=1 Tax=Rhodococcus sp. p52 TaxID=935199 RepID=UPI00051A1000|nr:hypothetical protein [Rhodococcus sp. p52]
MSIGDSTLKPGDQVTVSARGTFVFTVNDIDEDTGTAMIEVNADSPLTYPWPARVSDLYPSRTDWRESFLLPVALAPPVWYRSVLPLR